MEKHKTAAYALLGVLVLVSTNVLLAAPAEAGVIAQCGVAGGRCRHNGAAPGSVVDPCGIVLPGGDCEDSSAPAAAEGE